MPMFGKATSDSARRTAILCSGGLDSAVLMASELKTAHAAADEKPYIQPIYVSSGFAWESGERERAVEMLRAAPFVGAVEPLAHLACPVTDTYPETHWALAGNPPAYNTPDDDVYLIGRNILLLAKVSAYCAINRIGRVAVGLLAGNPFPDATPEFFAAMERALRQGLDHELRITAPFSALSKVDAIARGRALGVPFELTLSCMSPVGTRHCGRCSKCRERLQAFEAAGSTDPAPYAFRPHDVTRGV